MQFATKTVQRSPKAMQLRPQETGGFVLPKSVKVKKAHHFIHRPEGWRLEGEHGFVPTLGEIAAVPGVNGVRRANGDHSLGGPVDMSGAVQVLVREGCTYIDPNDARLGPYKGYDAHYYDTADGRRHHVMDWERCTVLPTGRVIWDDNVGQAGFLAFRIHLRDAGIVQPIADEVVMGMLHQLRNRKSGILSRAGAAADTAYIKAKVDAIDEQIAAIETAYEAMSAGSEPVSSPAPRRGKPSAKAGPDA